MSDKKCARLINVFSSLNFIGNILFAKMYGKKLLKTIRRPE
jgi:hypothetical protein